MKFIIKQKKQNNELMAPQNREIFNHINPQYPTLRTLYEMNLFLLSVSNCKILAFLLWTRSLPIVATNSSGFFNHLAGKV